MINETRAVLSSIFECVHAHADLTIRRTAPFPAHAAGRIDALIAEHRALPWPAPVSGSMGIQAVDQGEIPLRRSRSLIIRAMNVAHVNPIRLQ